MKKLNAITLGLFITASTAAFADNTGAVVHINGSVTEPTCAFTVPNQNVDLDPISVNELKTTSIGTATAVKEKQFQMQLSCEENVDQNKIKLVVSGTTSAAGDNAIFANSSADNGVGFEIIHGDTPLKAENELDLAQLVSLNNGNNTLDLTARYARTDDEIKGGSVDADVTFTVVYR